MRRTVCLVCIFLAAQLLASMVVMFFFNLPGLLRDGKLDLDVVASPEALGLSLVLSAALVWAVMALLRWTDRKSFRSRGYGGAVYGTLVLWMVPVIFLVNLLLERMRHRVVQGRMPAFPCVRICCVGRRLRLTLGSSGG